MYSLFLRGFISSKSNRTKNCLVLFQMDRMNFTWKSLDDLGKIRKQENPEQQHYVYNTKDRELMFKDMTNRMEQEYHLFRQDSMRLWVNIEKLFTNPSIEDKVNEFHKLLVEEYNLTIAQYKKMSGIDLEPRKIGSQTTLHDETELSVYRRSNYRLAVLDISPNLFIPSSIIS